MLQNYTKQIMELKKLHISQFFTIKNLLRVITPIILIITIFFMWQHKHSNEALLILQGSYDKSGDEFALVEESINYDKLLSSGLPVIIDYGKNACPVCQSMAPMLKTYNKKLHNLAYIKFVDSVNNPADLEKMGITYPPLQVFFTNKGEPYEPGQTITNDIVFYYIIQTKEGIKKEITSSELSSGLYNDSEILYTFHRGELTEAQFKSILLELGVNL